MTKRLVLSGLFVFGCFVCAYAGEAYVSPPVGMVRVEVASNSDTLVSMPFTPVDASLNNLFTNQLIGADNETDADRILQWDTDNQEYITSFLLDDAGSTNNGSWIYTETNGLSAETIAAGEGFWIQNRHADQQLYLVGEVILDETQTVTLVSGYNLFGFPFSEDIDLNDTALYISGAYGDTNSTGADQIIAGLSSNMYWLLDDAGSTNDGYWMETTDAVAGVTLSMGAGFWYDRLATNELWWTEIRPYSNHYMVGTNAPYVSSMQINTNQNAMVLQITPAGVSGEVFEILYTDIDETLHLMDQAVWAIADEDISVTGQNPIVWQDYGNSDRDAVTNIRGRLYLVGRQDIDNDSDALSDAREAFIYGTDRMDADTDDDGIEDGAEVNDRDTDPTDPADTYIAVYANSVVGSNSYDGLAASLTNGHGPKATIQSAAQRTVSGDTVEVAAGTYQENNLDSDTTITINPNGVININTD